MSALSDELGLSQEANVDPSTNLIRSFNKRNRKIKRLLLAAGLALFAAILILFSPELGFEHSAVGSGIACVGSAFFTLLAKK